SHTALSLPGQNCHANRKSVSQRCAGSSFYLDHASSKSGNENFYAVAAEYIPIAMEFCCAYKSTLIVSSAEISSQSSLGPTTIYSMRLQLEKARPGRRVAINETEEV